MKGRRLAEPRNDTGPGKHFPGARELSVGEAGDYFASSMSAAAPMPPPMHMVTTP